MEAQKCEGVGSAHKALVRGFFPCMECGHVYALDQVGKRCVLCRQVLFARRKDGVLGAWLFCLSGMIFYVASHVLPMMETGIFGGVYSNTIIGGISVFISHGDYFLASIIFLASIGVPVFKFFVIIWVLLSVRLNVVKLQGLKVRFYHIAHIVGRWSMVDFFVVLLLVVLFQQGNFVVIEPGWGALMFFLSVVMTMLSSQLIDVRLFYDQPLKS